MWRGFYLASVLLAVLAVGAQLGAISNNGKSTRLRARLTTLPAEQKPALQQKADDLTARGLTWGTIGFGLAFAAAISLCISLWRQEPGRVWLAPLAILLLFAGLYFIMV